jgi:hypothetical protein
MDGQSLVVQCLAAAMYVSSMRGAPWRMAGQKNISTQTSLYTPSERPLYLCISLDGDLRFPTK